MLAATPFVWFYAQYRAWQLALRRPAEMQERELLALLGQAAKTRFGRDHDFSAVTSVADFQERVPLRRYEDFWREYWQAGFPRLENCTWPGTIPYFALTSGTTTGASKYIPCSREMVEADFRAAGDILLYHLRNHPLSRVLAGKTLLLGGSTDLKEVAPGIRSGDLSGIEASEIPWWLQPSIFPPKEIALIADWEAKIDEIARRSLDEDIRAVSGTPNWLLLFFERLSALRPDAEPRIASFYPRLELLVHGGVDFRPYATRFAELLEGSRAELREVYPASEAFIAIADRGPGEGLRLVLDNGVFYEFVPTQELGAPRPTRHWIADAEPHVDYALILSTCAGLWAYVLGDTVRLVDLDPPRILVTGRTSYVLSAFGEHLIDAEIEEAVADAAAEIEAHVSDFCVAPVFPASAGEKAGHRFLVEFGEEVPSAHRLHRFAAALDRRLCALNADYRQHRSGSYGLAAPVAEAVAPGGFAAWMKSRGRLGGQHKVPRILNDEELFSNLRSFLSRAHGGK